MANSKNGAAAEQELFAPHALLSTQALRPMDFAFLHPLKPTVVFQTYWRFAVERQEIYHRRVRGESAPWSRDPVLQTSKFTNAYRAADRVSQYLIRHVIGDEARSAENTFFRILLFKLFNKIETWELFVSKFAEPCVEGFSARPYGEVLSEAFDRGERIYSAAYIMPSGGKSGFARKHQMHLHLLGEMLRAGVPDQIARAKTMEHAFTILRSWPTLGDFLAYQFITDLNYSGLTDFKESEFVVPGPGAKNGLRKCFTCCGGLSDADAIRLVTERQEDCLRTLGLRFPTLWGRRLQLVDCQNLFCEVDKYARVAHPEFSGPAGRTRIKQKLRPSTSPIQPIFPNKWGLNHRLREKPVYVPVP